MYTYNELNAVELSPTKKDYYQVWNELLDVAGKLSDRWDPSATNESDPGVVLLKVLTAVADKLSYNIDANTLEAFMPSAAQESSMRKLCEMLGYSMRFYASATTTARITYQGDYFPPTDSGDIKIDAFTNLKDNDNTINYLTLKEVTLSSSQRSKTVPCIEGELISCETSLGNYVTLDHLDDNRRFYLPERQVASNVGAIFVARRGTTAYWTQVDNLNTCLLGQDVFKFGYDSSMGLPFLEFPEDIGSRIGTGLEIKFIRTRGAQGNISVNTLKTMEQPLSWSNASNTSNNTVTAAEIADEDTSAIPTEWLELENYTVTNLAAARDGKDPETIDEAYWNFQKTIGTFDTLVTCRDYMNKIYRMTQSEISTTPLVSNAIVSDIRDDINRAYSLCTLTDGGVEYISKAHTYGTAITPVKSEDPNINKDKIQYFDLMLYPFVATNGLNTQAEYENSFKYSSAPISAILTNLKESQTIAHRFVSPEASEIVCVKVYFQLSARLSTTAKVTALEAAEVELAAHRALFRDFNMRNIDFGDELPFDQILKTLEGADARIKNVSLDDPKMYVAVCTRDDKEYPITGDHIFDTLEEAKKARDFYLDLVLRNVLAGKVSLFNYDTKFPSAFTDRQYPAGLVNTRTSASKLREGQEIQIMSTKKANAQVSLLANSKADSQPSFTAPLIAGDTTLYEPQTLAYLNTLPGALTVDLASNTPIEMQGLAKLFEQITIRLYEPAASKECYRIEYTPEYADSLKETCIGLRATIFSGSEGKELPLSQVKDFILDPFIKYPLDKDLPIKLCIIPFNNSSTSRIIDKATFDVILKDSSFTENAPTLKASFFDFNWADAEEELPEEGTAFKGFMPTPIKPEDTLVDIIQDKTLLYVEPSSDSEGLSTDFVGNTLSVVGSTEFAEELGDEAAYFIIKPYWKGVALPENSVDTAQLTPSWEESTQTLSLYLPSTTDSEAKAWPVAKLSLQGEETPPESEVSGYTFGLLPEGSSTVKPLAARLHSAFLKNTFEALGTGTGWENKVYVDNTVAKTDYDRLTFLLKITCPDSTSSDESNDAVYFPVVLDSNRDPEGKVKGLINWQEARTALINEYPNYRSTDSTCRISTIETKLPTDLQLVWNEDLKGLQLQGTIKAKYSIKSSIDSDFEASVEFDIPLADFDFVIIPKFEKEQQDPDFNFTLSFRGGDTTNSPTLTYPKCLAYSNSGLNCSLDIKNQDGKVTDQILIPNSFFNKDDYFVEAYQLRMTKDDLAYRTLSKMDDLAGIVPTTAFISLATEPLKIDCKKTGLDRLTVQAFIPSAWPTTGNTSGEGSSDSGEPIPALTINLTAPEVAKQVTYPTFLAAGSPYITIKADKNAGALTQLPPPEDLANMTLVSSEDLYKDTAGETTAAAELPKPTKITSAFPINTSYISPEEPLTLSANEVIQFRAPNLKTTATYPAYVNYYVHLDATVNSYARSNDSTPRSPATMQTLLEFFEGGLTDYVLPIRDTSKWNKKVSWETKLKSLPEINKFIFPSFDTIVDKDKIVDGYLRESEAASANLAYKRAMREYGAVFTKSKTTGDFELFIAESGDKIPANEIFYVFRLTSLNYVLFTQWLQGTRGNLVYRADVLDPWSTTAKEEEKAPNILKGEKLIKGVYTKSRSSTAREFGHLIDIEQCKYTLAESFPTGKNITELYVPRLWSNNTSDYTADGLGHNKAVNGIPANTEYQLKKGEYILFSYSSSEGREDGVAAVKNVAYTAGTIIKANFELLDSREQAAIVSYNKFSNFGPWTLPDAAKTIIAGADVGGIVSGMYTLGANDQIEIRERIEVGLNGNISNLYWELKDPYIVDGYEYLFHSGTATVDVEAGGYSYMLQPGEYLYYTDAAKENMAYYGSGTLVHFGDSTPDIRRLLSDNKISAEDINELGLVSAIPWTEVSLSGPGAEITIKEYQYLTLIDGDSLESIEFCDPSVNYIGDTPRSVVSASYKTNGLSGELPQLSIENGYWQVTSKLDISMNATRPQVLTVHQTSLGQEIARDILCLWGTKSVNNQTTEVLTQVYTPLVAAQEDDEIDAPLVDATTPIELLLAAAKVRAKEELGVKKPRKTITPAITYDTSSYDKYSQAFDAIRVEIESATTVATVPSDVTNRRFIAESNLKLEATVDSEKNIPVVTINELQDYAVNPLCAGQTFRVSATVKQVIDSENGDLLIADETGETTVHSVVKRNHLVSDDAATGLPYEDVPYKDLEKKPDEHDRIILDCTLAQPEGSGNDKNVIQDFEAVDAPVSNDDTGEDEGPDSEGGNNNPDGEGDSTDTPEEPGEGNGDDADNSDDDDTTSDIALPERSPVTAVEYTTDANGVPNTLSADSEGLPLDGQWEQSYGYALIEGRSYYLEDLLFVAEQREYQTASNEPALYHTPPHNSYFTQNRVVYQIDLEDSNIKNAPVIKKKQPNSNTWIPAAGVKIKIYETVSAEDAEEENLGASATGITPATLAVYSNTDIMGAAGEVSFLKNKATQIYKNIEFKSCQQEDLRFSDGTSFSAGTDEIGFTKIDLSRYNNRLKPYLKLNTLIPEHCFGLLAVYFDVDDQPASSIYLVPTFKTPDQELAIFNYFADNSTDKSIEESSWWKDQYDTSSNRYFLLPGLNTIKIPSSCSLAIYPTLGTESKLLISDLQLVPYNQQLNPKLGFDRIGALFKVKTEDAVPLSEDTAQENEDATVQANEAKAAREQAKRALDELLAQATPDATAIGTQAMAYAEATKQAALLELEKDQIIAQNLKQDFVPVQIIDTTYQGLFIKPDEVYKRIRDLDNEYKFFYTGQISTNYGLDLNAADPADTLLQAKNWFDTQNINNKFVVSEIDTQHLSNYVVVSKFSRG